MTLQEALAENKQLKERNKALEAAQLSAAVSMRGTLTDDDGDDFLKTLERIGNAQDTLKESGYVYDRKLRKAIDTWTYSYSMALPQDKPTIRREVSAELMAYGRKQLRK